MEPLQIVWFKRDLRCADHEPLLLASRLGPVLPLVVVEPELWQQADASARQWAFVRECLLELRRELAALGQPLVVRLGTAVQVLEQARLRFGIAGLWSHQETGNGWTYARDRQVLAWARRHGIAWTELPPYGVTRRLASRDGWARRWQQRMAGAPLAAPPALAPLAGIAPGRLPTLQDLGLTADPCPGRQPGGRRQGLALLESFLVRRGAAYHRELSSPATALTSCSRLSPHLAWGTLSLREVVQRSRARRQELQALPGAETSGRLRALRAFEERLHWHCHFIQKLEDEPELEFRALHPLTADLRRPDAALLQAWATGRTGIPFVDACMRSLIATGWLNFRMRAMLQSVATYQLWLPWRDSGLVLARLFVDYEPGIHWCQCQMQAGTTGINTIRIYNPVKQGQDHDPQGRFIRRWLPELERVPLVHLHEPWTLSRAGQEQLGWRLGRDYPEPVVDLAAAARQARERLWSLRRQEGFAERADAIQARHGSRRAGLMGSAGRRRRGRAPVVVDPRAPQQLELF
ncbi:MAG: FAD-binding domain-containing protein [Synechococcaceae cyanobacterium]|nr:FAD-binding domain-containing protein [Synechococcaceae cyanobacterium]